MDQTPDNNDLPNQYTLFQKLIENIPDLLFRMSLPDGNFDYISKSAFTITGFTTDEIINSPELISRFFHCLPDRYNSGKHQCPILKGMPTNCEFSALHKSGKVLWLNQRCTITRDENQQAIAVKGIITDISERKATEEALRESEKRYRDLLESSPDWVWEVDANATYTYVSPKIYDLLGYRPEEIIGKTPFDLMPESEALRVSKDFTKIAENKLPFFNLETTNLHKNKQKVVLETSGVPIIADNGELLGYRGIDRDITQRKSNEAELRKQRDFTNTVLEVAGNIIVVLDLEGRFCHFNNAAEKITGYSRDDVLGKPVWDYVIPPEQRSGVMNVFNNLCADNIEIASQYENEWLTRDGQRRLLSWHNSVLHNDEGTVSHIVTMGYDITDQKKMETSLREREKELAAIIDHIPSIIFLKNADDLHYVRWNNAGEKTTGISASNIIGKSDYDLFPKDQADAFTSRDRAVLSSGQLEDIPDEAIDTPYGTRSMHTRKIAIYDENNNPKYLLGIADDITDIKAANAEQKRLQLELQQAQKMESLGHLTGGIAHDFNNLLGIINGFASLAITTCSDSTDSKLSGYLNHVVDAGERAAKLISQMLAFSRSEQIQSSAIDLAPLIKEDIKMLRATLPSTIEITTRIASGLPAVIMNPTQLHQILMNLSINSRDAMEGKGQLTISLDWARNLDTESPISHKPIIGDWIELSVTDTGSGIDTTIEHDIFNPFFTTKPVGKGSGMGLSVIYSIVESHQGHILLESKLNHGTTFRILFPALTEKPLPHEIIDTHKLNLPKGNGENILIVDDEPSLGIMLSEIINTYNYKTTIVSDSEEALLLLQEQPDNFSLLITDQTMPKLTGTELIIQARKIIPQLPSILCTGYSDEINEHSARRMDINYFKKPVETSKLIHEINNLIKT
ncbi:MAG: PAS domain S-box protein [Gammaproteobacteria bacterium]|nr:PAS domain S-box protein [Gammaproteobacteria bacterium]